MRLPALAAAVLTATALAVAPTHAGAAALSCNLVTDPTGDAVYNSHVPGGTTDDLVGADLAVDAKTLTGVVKLAAVASPDTAWPTGHVYTVLFSAKGHDALYFLQARTYPQGPAFIFGYQAPDPTSGINTNYVVASAKGVLDTAKGQVRISIPLATIASTVKLTKGLRLSSLEAQSDRIAGQGFVPSQSVGPSPRIPLGGLLLPFDDATSSKKYYVGTPSCVKPVS